MKTAGMFLIFLLILAVTRLPIAPEYLYHFDSVNFALSLSSFNPARHQPQPPGYPLFVGLLRLVHWIVPAPEDVLVVGGLLAGATALLFLWKLSSDMFGARAGLLTASLLVFNPPFWMGGITNPVRLCLAFCSAGVAFLAWRALRQPGKPVWLYLSFAALGVADGFRPTMGALLAPLVLWVWWQTGRSPARLALGCLAAITAAIPWVTATAAAVGGFTPWLELMWLYANDQFGGTSAVFGAATTPAWRMATYAIVWNALGTLAWVWAVPFVRARRHDAEWRRKTAFLLVWAGPVFLFSAVIHIGDPDQALGSIPALCLVGGAVLASFLNRFRTVPPGLTAAAVAAINALLFFVPPGAIARASSYKTIRGNDREAAATIHAIEELRGFGPATILHHEALLSWRHLFYYFPEDFVVYLPASTAEQGWTLRHRKIVAEDDLPRGSLPAGRRLLLVTPSSFAAEITAKGWKQHGPIFYLDNASRRSIQVGPYRLSHVGPVEGLGKAANR